MTQDEQARHIEAALLGSCVVIALVCAVYPLYVIRPFRAQGPTELAWALGMMHFRGAVTALCAIAALLTLLAYWQRQSSRLRRAAAITAVLVTLAAALFARVNVYERMFRPNAQPAFVAAAKAPLGATEKVLAVRSAGGAARAYPVRSMSYHHVVNDTLDGTPIVATY